MLYNAEVRSRSAATPRMGHQDISVSSSVSPRIVLPGRNSKRGKRDGQTCTLCLGVCLAVCICCFLYIHFFISPIDKAKIHNIQKISLDVAGHVGKHFERKGETILQANVKRLNPKTVVRGKPSQAYSNLRPLHASNTFQDPNPHVKTDEEIEMEAMKETIAEWKERDGVSSEGRFKVFKKYNGRHHKPTPVTAQRKKYRRSVGINLGSDISDKSISKFIKSLDDDSTVQCKDFSGRTIPLEKDMFNDDYCDCQDGSDEPGTSACAGISFRRNTKFFCSKSRTYIYSSRVNDGFCDCCDGEDEYKGVTKCEDRCK